MRIFLLGQLDMKDGKLETPMEAALRETYEETDLTEGRDFTVYENFKMDIETTTKKRGRKKIMNLYAAFLTNENAKIILNKGLDHEHREHFKYFWWDKQTIMSSNEVNEDFKDRLDKFEIEIRAEIKKKKEVEQRS